MLRLDRDDDEAEQLIRVALERRTERELRRVMRDMMDTMFPAGYGEWTNPQDAVAQIQARYRMERQMYDALERALVDGVDLGVSVAVAQLEGVGFGFDWTLANTEARDWARQYAGELARQIDATNRRVIGEATARWIENGEPIDALRDDLLPYFGERRARLIATTEPTRAFAEGNARAWQASGVVDEVEWTASMDERVCPVCGGLHGKRRKLNEPFDTGIMRPPAHPGCRCWIRPVVPTPEEVAARGG